MQTSVVIILTITMALSLGYGVQAMAFAESWFCSPCTSRKECDADPGLCIWGEARDRCNRRICAKGPGERCGGSLNILGICGEGMMCKSDERCHGCSIQTMECFN